MKNEFSTLEVIQVLNITRNRIREWLREGYILPSIAESSGQGIKNVFSRWDLYGIELFKRLVESGMGRKEAHILLHGWFIKAEKISIHKRADIKKYVVVAYLKDNRFALYPKFVKNESIDSLFKEFPTWDRTMIFNMEKIIESVDLKIIK